MTIAEVFLLLMFVMWLGSVIADEGLGGELDPTFLKEELDRQNKKLQDMSAERDRLKNTAEALRIMLGAPTLSERDLKDALLRKMSEAADAARRGKPACSSANVLVDVSADAGRMSVTVVTTDRSVLDWLKERHVNGDRLAEQAGQSALFEATRSWYVEHDCRFDYRLQYRTAEDYQRGRQTFEQFYYPAGIRAIP
jgi:hypothetical protein